MKSEQRMYFLLLHYCKPLFYHYMPGLFHEQLPTPVQAAHRLFEMDQPGKSILIHASFVYWKDHADFNRAVVSISTRAPFGNPATATVERAGGSWLKNSP